MCCLYMMVTSCLASSCSSIGGGKARRTNEKPRRWGRRVAANNDTKEEKWVQTLATMCLFTLVGTEMFVPKQKHVSLFRPKVSEFVLE